MTIDEPALIGRTLRSARDIGARGARAARSRVLGAHNEAPATDTAPASVGLPDDYLHQLLHELRTTELRHLDMDGGTAVSIGAAGRWYFEWFEDAVGRLDEHIGIEAFEAPPDDLPANARWISSTADRFEGVADDSVDLVFAGQTTEHLWAGELTDFLLESNRVLRDDGLLVIDSPNRMVTEHLHWAHGGHTVELCASEMTDLLEMAGFAVERCSGVLLSRFDGVVLQLTEGLDRGDTGARRILGASDDIDDFFIWWIEAKRISAPATREDLLALVERFYWVHWPIRVSRGAWYPGAQPGRDIPAEMRGIVARTLPFPLAAGTWALGLDVTGEGAAEGIEVRLLDSDGAVFHVLKGTDAWPSDGRLTWAVEQPTLVFDCMIDITATAPSDDLEVTLPLDLRATAGVGVRAPS